MKRRSLFPWPISSRKFDLSGAEALVKELEKPLAEISPLFLLKDFEGHRSISFDLEHGTTLYYSPAPTPAA